MTENTDQLLDTITRVVPALLTALEAFDQVQANLHPPQLPELMNFLQPFADTLQAEHDYFSNVEFPADARHIREVIGQANGYCLRACDSLSQAAASAGSDFGAVMRAMRAHARAQEYIYGLAGPLSPVSQYFLEPAAREDHELIRALAAPQGAMKTGIISAGNDRSERGGFSVYVPENLLPQQPAPVVMVLHGGTGHGADFLWSWLREARTRGFILVAPTSIGETWSINEEDVDLQHLLRVLRFVQQEWSVDSGRIMLAGMSDGATFSLIAGLNANSPFTHLAPFSGVLHPELALLDRLQYARNKPIYLVHGTRDWMFPVEIALMAEQQLNAAGASLTYRQIEGLSHQFARREIPALMDWFRATEAH
ncbi:MAG: hypothetical protein KDI36_16745 [Pseudomonadales bacterium]|nr:hypothetical protein [Pseudomonadales bacterium]